MVEALLGGLSPTRFLQEYWQKTPAGAPGAARFLWRGLPRQDVSPHLDNYDVFLIQGTGQRHWQIANQDDRNQSPDAPLKILQRFGPAHDWMREPGDMLYLPPHWAHNGVAIGQYTTYIRLDSAHPPRRNWPGSFSAGCRSA